MYTIDRIFAVPGLLFFLESTKTVEATTPKRSFRKSMTVGKPIFASMEDLRVLSNVPFCIVLTFDSLLGGH